MKTNVYYSGFLATVLLVLATGSGNIFATTATETTQPPETINQTQTTQEEGVRVAVAEGSNFTLQYYTFTPQTVDINAGESVTWYTPAEFSEIHTVTFVLDENVMSDIILPFAVPEETDFELLPPFNLGEPIIIETPDGREAIVAVNKHGFYPAVVDANNQTTYFNETDIQYTMDSTERVINSGIIFPEMPPSDEATTPEAIEGQQEPPLEPPLEPPFPLVSSFTVTFEEPGTYPYICAIHPWMTGEVVVLEGENQTATAEAGNQTGT